MSGINISKYLPNRNPFTNLKLPSISNPLNTPYSYVPSISASTNGYKATNYNQPNILYRVLAYVLALFIVIMVILLFIHFMIRPIFNTEPGGPGIITIPGMSDGKLYWSEDVSEIKDKDTPIHDITYNYSINMDFFIENPMQFEKMPRILFQRGGILKQQPTAETLTGIIDNYNLVVALAPDTNDMIISLLNANNNMENVVLPNVPVQEPFRIGIVVMERAMEVYINGRLIKTRTFTDTPKHAPGSIYPPQGINASIAKIRNLKIWNRILTTSEIRYATPSLSSSNIFNPSAIPSSGPVCALPSISESQIINPLSNIINKM